MIGTTLRHYRIEAKLGSGGMGVVYRALDTHLDRQVAIKVLPASSLADPDRRARFAQEAKSASALSHRNIITIYDIDTAQVDGQPVDFIAMQYVSGKTLEQMIGRKGVRLSDALRYAIQIADGLAAAHQAGIVHRDLKPGNVIVDEQGEVKILDFGLAKLTEPEEPDAFAATESVPLKAETEVGTILGTVAYMSPEQADGHKVDARSDIFSFGAVLYEIVTGRRAFLGGSKLSTLASVLHRDPEPLRPGEDNVPRELERVILRCLRKDPQRRWQSMSDVKVALEDVLEDLESTKLIAPPAVEKSRNSLRMLVWSGLILLAVLAGAFLGWRTLRSPQPSFERLTYRRGDVDAARFSPDSQTVLYSAQWGDEPMTIFSMRPGSRESRSLDLPEGRILSISSTEMAILIGDSLASAGVLARVPLSGGAPREVLENVNDADWSPDGSKLAVSHTVGGRTRIEYPIGNVLYEKEGRPPYDLRVSPKGDLLAFFEYDDAIGDFAVTVLDLHGKKRILSRGWRASAHLAWSPKGDEVWFGAGAKDGFNTGLQAVSLNNKERTVVETPAIMAMDDVSRDGRVLATTEDTRMGISALPPGAKQETDLSWFDASHVYDISPDGRSIVFVESSYVHGRNAAIYLRKTDGSPAVRLGEGAVPALSPDGKWVSCVVSDGPQSKLTLLPTGAGEARSLGAEGVHYGPAEWFPDGLRILFTGNEAGRPARTFVQDVRGGKPVAITPEGAIAHAISPDQKFATAVSGGRLSLIPLAGVGEPRVIANLDGGESVVRWSGDGKYIYLRQIDKPYSMKINRLEVSTGRKELWKQLQTPDPVGVRMIDLVMTPDGSSYAYSFQRDIVTLFLVNHLK